MRPAPVGLALALALAGTVARAQDSGAREVIALSRTTTATYSVYHWVAIAIPRIAPFGEWSAEFHDGHLHRVETPRERIVADCAARTGAHFTVATGRTRHGRQYANLACGIQANSTITSAVEDPSGDGPFGITRRIRVRDRQNLRTYEVAANGAIVRNTIADLEGHVRLSSRAMALLDSVPAGIFSEDSLASSVVAEQFRKPPID